MRLTFLGTTGSIPTATRDSTHYLVATDDGATALLVDVGGSTYYHLRRIGFEPANLSAVILTHEHCDHIHGFPALMTALTLLPERVELPVYATEGAMATAIALCEVFGMELDGERLTVRWHPIERGGAGSEFTVDGTMRVSSILSAHSLPCAALKFEEVATGATLVSSSDSEYNPALAEFACGCDLLIHDCYGPEGYEGGHASAADVARSANDAKAKALMPIHIVEPALAETMNILNEQAACPVLEPKDKIPIRIGPDRLAAYEGAT